MKNFFYHFKENFISIFKGKNLLWHFFAIALTYILVVSDFDWKYYEFFSGSTLQGVLLSAAVVGGLLPILLPIALFVTGKIEKKASLLAASYATFQAAFFGWFVSSLYKVFTGRIQPPLFSGGLADISREFQFGIFRHGIFWGWPSSHAAVAFAVATALYIMYPKSRAVRIVAIATALYIGIGISMNIHWFSDFIAGAIIGAVIGVVVGKSFYKLKTELSG